MGRLLANGMAFVRENPRILYSIVLVVFVPAAFFLNTYFIISRFESDIDRITQRKAVLVEGVISGSVREHIDDTAALQRSVEDISQDNPEISTLAILRPDGNGDRFEIVAAHDSGAVGARTDDIQFTLAWKQSEGIAVLGSDQEGRFWRVTKSIADTAGEKIALVSMTFPLADSDALIDRTVNDSYLLLLVTVLVAILLVSNQARLFGYLLTLNRLKEVDKMKDTFVSMASHELRSPLTAIKGYVEFLGEKRNGLDQEGRHYLDNIESSVNRLNALVEDMLEVSRLEGNRIPFDITVFDPAKLITQSVEEMRSQAMQKGLELVVESGPPVSIRADENRLKQVIVNLVSNAIKYTPKGKVTVSFRARDKECLITVADTGLGISSEDQEKLFQKFNRIRNDRTKDIAGTGLGLWITMELVQRMNGTVSVESIEGVGSHFTVHIPLS